MSYDPTEVKRLMAVRKMYANGEAKRIREAAAISQSEFADALGVSRATVCLWEAGTRIPERTRAADCWQLLELLQKG